MQLIKKIFLIKNPIKDDEMISIDEFVISSANDVPGYEILETKGFVNGLTVRSQRIDGEIGGKLRFILGGK